MFFRNQKPKVENFEERIAGLKELRFTATMESATRCRVTRDGCGAIIEDLGGGKMGIGKAGVLVGGEIALLIHGGYQMFLRTPSGKEVPALAPHLKALHEFDGDLREGLGLTTLYNLALGTVCDDHLYDRVEDRDAGPQHYAWNK
ncbi:MAG: hypothetical protein ABI833_18295 [Acidobacteriota bacterium]